MLSRAFRLRFPLLVLIGLSLALPAPARAVDLQQLIRDVEQQYMGVSSHSRMEMEVTTEHWQRHLTMEAWSLGREYFLVRILDPPKERGVATLKVQQEVWNYLPKVDRVIKVPPSMMGGAWMGSHITNDDLVKANHIDQDYTFTLLAETPKSGASRGCRSPTRRWSGARSSTRSAKRRGCRCGSSTTTRGAQVRQIVFSDVQKIGSRTLPLRMTVQPTDKPEEHTVLHYDAIDFDIGIKTDFFSLRNLKAR